MGRDDLSEEKFLIIDGNSLINRAFYGLYGRQNLTAPDGTPTGALFTFLNIYLKLIEEQKPTHVAVAFDCKEETFRHQLFDAYKGTRKPTPDELAIQIPLLKELLEAMGVKCIEKPGFEADDLIGTLSRMGSREMPVMIVSGDKDSMQLADERVVILLPVTRAAQTQVEQYDSKTIQERYGISPRQFIDVKALMGDPSDNIPGVRGIGEKTALELIKRYGSLEGVYNALDEIRPSIAKKLEEGRELAFLSRELATICQTVPLEVDLEQFRLRSPNVDKLAEMLTELGFKTILSRLNLEAKAASLPAHKRTIYDVTLSDLKDDLKKRTDPVTLLLKTQNPICFIDSEDRVCRLKGESIEAVFDVLHQKDTLYFVYDFKTWLRENRIFDASLRIHDVLIAAYLLNQLEGKPDLERIYQRITGQALPAASNDEEKEAVLTRAIKTAGVRQRDELKERNLFFIADEVEFPLSAILAEMELRGFSLDLKVLQALSEQMEKKQNELQTQIYQLCGKEFNINSQKQLSEVLYIDLGLKPGKRRSGGTFSTDADELERLSGEHPVISLIIEYRQIAKLRATFVEGLMKVVDPEDGRVHTTFNQTLTATGRLSSSEPNLQNIPIRTAEGRKIRYAFIAPPGCLLIDADYSQIELRLLAHLSGDPAMIEAFVNHEDIHTDTACRLFGLPPEKITPEMRSIAKTMNFSIIYGISDYGLARDLGLSVREAHKLIADYEARYPRVREYLNKVVADAVEKGYVETMFGRRRYLPELKSTNRNVRQFGERAAMNAPIQGSAADIIKIAMVRVDRALKSAALKAGLILQVHDELILESPEKEVDKAEKLLRDAMESAADLSVPLVVDISLGRSWAECKDKGGESPFEDGEGRE